MFCMVDPNNRLLKLEYKQELQKEARSNGNVAFLMDDENLMGEKSR